MAATQRSSALAHAAFAALLACALAAPEYNPSSIKHYSSHKPTKTTGGWKSIETPTYQVNTPTLQRTKAEIEPNLELAPKADIIPSTESFNKSEAGYILSKPNGIIDNYNNDKDISKNGNSQKGQLGDSKPVYNTQSSSVAPDIWSQDSITFPIDKAEVHPSIGNINLNKINPADAYFSNGNSSTATPGNDDTGKSSAPESEQKGRPLFMDVSKPVNERFPHAVLFGGTCGGSIISPNWILTAAHCTLFTGGRYVLAGTNRSDDGSGVTRRVKKLHVHPLFSVGPYWLDAYKYEIKQVSARWDFMLVELDEPLELDGVTLAAVPLQDAELAPGTFAGYAGYGTDHHGGTMRMEMHAMDLQVKNDVRCKTLREYNSNDMLCAQGYSPKFDSACNGDSGSGLVAGGRLAGVASWVENDAIECKNGNLVVFSKVFAVRHWIKRVSGI